MLVLAGLMAGAIAAVVASVVSLPLNSPLDSVFNSATVTVAAIAVGLLAGLLWMWLAAKILWYGITLAALLGVVVAVTSLGDRLPGGLGELLDLDRLASFSVPLAVIIIGGCAILTPLLASMLLKPVFALLKWAPVIALAIALAVGFGLITQGDSEAVELALPERPVATVTALIRTPAPTVVALLATTVAPTVVAAVSGAMADSTTTPATATPPTSPTTAPATVTPSAPTAAPTATPPASGDAAQTFIISDGSIVTFTVAEELTSAPVRFDAVITGAGLSGAAHLDGRPSVVNLDLHSLSSDQTYRDRYIRDRMFPDTPEAVFTVDQLPALPPAFFAGEETAGELNGSLQIGETVTPLLFQVTARHDGDVINILGQTTFQWDDLGLDKPSARSVIFLADEVEVQVLLIARAP